MKPAPFLYERPDERRGDGRAAARARRRGEGARRRPVARAAAQPAAVAAGGARRHQPRRGPRPSTKAARWARPCASASFAGVPLVALALPFVGHLVTRNRGTIGGSIAHADASAELPLCLVVLGGTVRTSDGRELRREEFFVSHYTTAARARRAAARDHVAERGRGRLRRVRAPPRRLRARGVRVLARDRRRHDRARHASASVRSSSARPCSTSISAGAPATPETAREAGARATALVDRFGNQHATAAYLRSLTGTVVERALTQAFGQAAA